MKHWKWNRISRLESYLCWRRLRKEERNIWDICYDFSRSQSERGKRRWKLPRRRTLTAGRLTIAVINFPRFSPLIFSHFLAIAAAARNMIIGSTRTCPDRIFSPLSVKVNSRKENIFKHLTPVSCLITNSRDEFALLNRPIELILFLI